jgi:hypothetical protein
MTTKTRIEKLEKRTRPGEPKIIVLWDDTSGEKRATVNGATMPESEYWRRWPQPLGGRVVRVAVDWEKL